jgi:hypothetical protein
VKMGRGRGLENGSGRSPGAGALSCPRFKPSSGGRVEPAPGSVGGPERDRRGDVSLWRDGGSIGKGSGGLPWPTGGIGPGAQEVQAAVQCSADVPHSCAPALLHYCTAACALCTT